MGRYGNIELITEDEARQSPSLFTAKMSWKGHFIVAMFLLGWSVIFPSFLGMNGLFSIGDSLFTMVFSSFVWFICSTTVLTCALVGLIFLFSALAAMRDSNWTLRAAPEGLYLKLRNYSDYRLNPADPIVAFIPGREIRELRFVTAKTRMIGDKEIPEDGTLQKEESLEILLYGGDLGEIGAALEAERARTGPTLIKGVTARAKGAALQLMAETGVIRVDWTTRMTRLQPKIGKAREVLTGLYMTGGRQEPDEAPIRDLSPEEQDARLREMVRRGDRIDATSLARDLHGLSLTEAHQYLKSL